MFEANKSGDYHKNFNHTSYKEWIEQKFVPAIEKASPGRAVLMHLDGAKYHWSRSNETRELSTLKKEELRQWLRDCDVPFSQSDLKPVLLDKAMQVWARR